LTYYTLSKELDEREQTALMQENGFVFSSGNLKLMDLCYCPFGKTCANCDKKDVYLLTDENERVFPVRRFIAANGDCRFEVYNCADLISSGLTGVGRLYDLTLTKDKQKVLNANTEEQQKACYKNYTSGHFKRGIL